jgi:predicted alpha/beta hydrolase family esterase
MGFEIQREYWNIGRKDVWNKGIKDIRGMTGIKLDDWNKAIAVARPCNRRPALDDWNRRPLDDWNKAIEPVATATGAL